MMDYIGVILLACFVAIVVVGPISCVIYARRREHQKYHPTPKAFQRARRKLSSVTECRKQYEKCVKENEAWIGDCPICMGPLCPVMTHGSNSAGKEAKTGVAPIAEVKAEVRDRPDAEDATDVGAEEETIAGPAGRDDAAPDPSASKEVVATGDTPEEGQGQGHDQDHASRERAKNAAAPASPTDRDMEILKLKPCGHSFHSRCLTSWFLIERYDCPVCRTRYYMGPYEKSLLGGMAPTSYSMTSARMTIGSVV